MGAPSPFHTQLPIGLAAESYFKAGDIILLSTLSAIGLFRELIVEHTYISLPSHREKMLEAQGEPSQGGRPIQLNSRVSHYINYLSYRTVSGC